MYRGVVLLSGDNALPITTEEEAGLPDAELLAAAIRMLEAADVIGADPPRIPREALADRLRIMDID